MGVDPGHAPVVDKAATATSILTEDLQLMQQLIKGSNSEKAELFAAVQHDFDTVPTATHKLRMALAMATYTTSGTSPGSSAATNQAEALHMLQQLMVNPEGLMPGEQALAQVVMKQIDDTLHLQQKAENLSADASRVEGLKAQLRKVQADSEERLKELNEAKAKLDAIAKIEKASGRHPQAQ